MFLLLPFWLREKSFEKGSSGILIFYRKFLGFALMTILRPHNGCKLLDRTTRRTSVSINKYQRLIMHCCFWVFLFFFHKPLISLLCDLQQALQFSSIGTYRGQPNSLGFFDFGTGSWWWLSLRLSSTIVSPFQLKTCASSISPAFSSPALLSFSLSLKLTTKFIRNPDIEFNEGNMF